MDTSEALLMTSEVAQCVGLSIGQINYLIQQRRLPRPVAWMSGGPVLWTKADIDAWLATLPEPEIAAIVEQLQDVKCQYGTLRARPTLPDGSSLASAIVDN